MRKIILDTLEKDTVDFCEVDESNPIFAKQYEEFVGMIVKENGKWILRLGGADGCSGFQSTLRECLVRASVYGYEFYEGKKCI